MGSGPQGSGINRVTWWGSFTRTGVLVALFTCALDQASKLWLLFVFHIAEKGRVNVAPFVDFVLTWNTGISYGLFRQEGAFGQWVLLAFKVVAVVLLWIWLARAGGRLAAIGLGLIIGGAIGNGIDRLAYGAVVDFVLFYINTPDLKFTWYVFNLADAAIVAGVAGLLYDSLTAGAAAKAP
jgi:signal peptidase II